jgi:phage recombination protein Bet
VAHTGPASDLAIVDGQTFWTEKQKAALQQLGIGNAQDADLAVFFHHCTRTGLDPFARQIYMIERWTKNGPRQTIQTGIDGFRLIARRATDRRNGTFGYEPTLWCGDDGQWVDVWLSKTPPAAAKVTVIRDGSTFPAVALYSEYAGTDKQGNPTQMWRDKGSLMLAKCAEALALRKAFPQDLSGLYTADEMDQAQQAEPQAQTGRAVLQAALAQPTHTDDPEPPEPADDFTPDPITARQLTALNAAVTELGFDRGQKLAGVAATIGREVETTKDLTKDEATRVIKALKAEAEKRQMDSAAEVVQGKLIES